MAPTRNSVELHRSVTEPPSSTNSDDFPALFIDLILGTPLAMYVDKDVQDRDVLVDLIVVSRVAYLLPVLSLLA